MAERLIEYKKKISEQWLEKADTIKNDESEDDDEPPKKEMLLTKINKK